jgi:hypothetical protein
MSLTVSQVTHIVVLLHRNFINNWNLLLQYKTIFQPDIAADKPLADPKYGVKFGLKFLQGPNELNASSSLVESTASDFF